MIIIIVLYNSLPFYCTVTCPALMGIAFCGNLSVLWKIWTAALFSLLFGKWTLCIMVIWSKYMLLNHSSSQISLLRYYYHDLLCYRISS